MVNGSGQVFSTDMLDHAIEDARNTKKTMDSKMDSIMRLMREVECKEKAAEDAKEEADLCSLNILPQLDELKQAQQLAKEKNDMHAREVYAQKAALESEMKELQIRASGMLNEGDESIATLDEMCKSLEERLASALMKKEAANKEKLEKEVSLAYQKMMMEKMVEESKRLKQEEMENSKMLEFLKDRGHIVDMLQEDMYCKSVDVKLLNSELEDKQHENQILDVIEHMVKPLFQEVTWQKPEESLSPNNQQLSTCQRQGCECYQCKLNGEFEDYRDHENETLFTTQNLNPTIYEVTVPEYVICNCFKCNYVMKGYNGRLVPNKEMKKTKRVCRSMVQNSKNKETKKWIDGAIKEAITDYEQDELETC